MISLYPDTARRHNGENVNKKDVSMIYTTRYISPLGEILLAAEGDALTGLWFIGQKYFPGFLKEPVTEQGDYPVFPTVQNWLDRYFTNQKPKISELKLAPAGGEFKKMVWQILCEIPYGELITYGKISKKIAARLGRPHMSAQAVGGAVGHNAISIIIPCHRVVGANGSLTGYAGGIDRKIQLLRHEGVSMKNLFVPAKSTAP